MLRMMHTTNQILDEISKRYGGCSDYRLAKLLTTSSQTVSGWRSGRTRLSLDFALRAAALLEWEAAYVVACVEHERAERDARLEQTDEIKATWEKIAQHFKPAAAVILAVLLGLATPAKTEASARPRARDHVDAIYIMRSTKAFVRRLVRRVAQFWRSRLSAALNVTVTGACA